MTAAAISAARPGFSDKVRAEWTKLRSTRAFYIQLGLAMLFAIGLSLLIALAVTASWGEMTEGDREGFDPLFVSLIGPAFAGIVLVITGVTMMSSEYTSGMIRLTMAGTPKRLQVLFAKALVLTIVMTVIGLLVYGSAFIAGQGMLKTNADVPQLSLSDGDTQRALLVGWLTTGFFPLIGLCLGAILRSTASAITAVMGLIFVPGIFGGLLPRVLQENVLAYLPGNAVSSLQEDVDSVTHLDPPVALFMTVLWLVIFLGVAGALMLRRDV